MQNMWNVNTRTVFVVVGMIKKRDVINIRIISQQNLVSESYKIL